MRAFSEIPRFSNVSQTDWDDYRWQLRNRLTTLADLEEVLHLSAGQRQELSSCFERFRVSISPYWASLMDPDDPRCPIRLQAVPSPAELVSRPEDLRDSIGEDFDSTTRRITHRYPDRVLFLLTEMCSMYCRHCTRRRLVGQTEAMVPDADIDDAIRYIERSKDVRDVLISGGDPFVLGDDQLESVLARVRRIEHVEIIRFGTRTPVVLPQRITPQLCEMLRRYHPIWVNTQFNHPREITPESTAACGLLADAGIPLGNQSVLLRGVNDDALVMKRLVQKLVAIRVRPYYIFQCDLEHGIGHFRVPLSKGIEIMETLRGHTSGLCIPTYCLEAVEGGGKIPIAPNYVLAQKPGRWILRNYEGIISTYTEPDDYTEREAKADDSRCSEETRQGVAGLFAGHPTTLTYVTEKRLQKVKDRKARMSEPVDLDDVGVPSSGVRASRP